MSAAPDTLDLDLAKTLYDNMKILVEEEIMKRTELHDKVKPDHWSFRRVQILFISSALI